MADPPVIFPEPSAPPIVVPTEAELPDYVKRLEDEHSQLIDRIDKLATFLDGEVFVSLPRMDQELLKIQRETMGSYLAVLDIRLRMMLEALA
jgi:hypothetical protein